MIALILEHVPVLLVLLVTGCVSGLLAGLLGVGGGIVLVPALYYTIAGFGYGDVVAMHMALGTSLAIIIPTGLSSARAHYKRAAVSGTLVLRIGGGILAGVVAGTMAADILSGAVLKAIFAFVILGLAILMTIDPARMTPHPRSLQQPFASLAGVCIGFVSTLVGIGGATISVPYMTFSGVAMHRAIGTAAALGLIISIPAALGFIVIGADVPGRPPLSWGYVNMPSWGVIVPAAVLCAPLGARLAHRLSVRRLRFVFAAIITLVALRMIYGVFYG